VSDRDLDEQIAAAVRAGAATVRAPERLRRRMAEQRAARPRRSLVPRLAVAATLSAALALGFVLVASGAPSVQDVAAAALNAATRPAPAQDPRDPTAIAERAAGLKFPSYAEPWGWKPVGARTDSVAGRRAVTVIYGKGGRGVHYTIVEGEPLPRPDGARVVTAGDREFAVVRHRGAQVLAWEREGHTCVLASQAVDLAGLLKLATWR
jgi:hypothetical protein